MKYFQLISVFFASPLVRFGGATQGIAEKADHVIVNIHPDFTIPGPLQHMKESFPMNPYNPFQALEEITTEDLDKLLKNALNSPFPDETKRQNYISAIRAVLKKREDKLAEAMVINKAHIEKWEINHLASFRELIILGQAPKEMLPLIDHIALTKFAAAESAKGSITNYMNSMSFKDMEAFLMAATDLQRKPPFPNSIDNLNVVVESILQDKKFLQGVASTIHVVGSLDVHHLKGIYEMLRAKSVADLKSLNLPKNLFSRSSLHDLYFARAKAATLPSKSMRAAVKKMINREFSSRIWHHESLDGFIDQFQRQFAWEKAELTKGLNKAEASKVLDDIRNYKEWVLPLLRKRVDAGYQPENKLAIPDIAE